MPTDAFISYSHADEARRDRLSKHLVMLRREGSLAEWSDHEILAGDQLSEEISNALEAAGIFIALLSPDYLASSYCYEKEFQRALSLSAAGRLRIVGIVVEPCDWQSSPFKDLLILPKDGKPISEWTNENTAFLNVTTEMRRILERAPTPDRASRVGSPAPSGSPARRVRVKRDFDAIERAEFADQAYLEVASYFKKACAEMHEASDQIRARYEDMGATAFTCTLVNRGKLRGGEAHVTIRNTKGRHYGAGLTFLWQAHGEEGTSNGSLRVDADEYALYLAGSIERFGLGRDDEQQTPAQAAEKLWNSFMQQAGLEFE